MRETYQGIERAEELEEGEPEELVEDGEKAGDESEGIDTERDIPEGEEGEEGEEEEEGEEGEEGEDEEENIQGQREEQPDRQQVDPCGSSNAPLGL